MHRSSIGILFHGFIAVAPLKRRCQSRLRRIAIVALPRLHRRGPIEASRSALQLGIGRRSLPRLHRRGPIEACRIGVERSRSCRALPRLHRRGPIEASRCRARSRCRRLLFHGFIAVAPLKRRCSAQLLDAVACVFHGFIAVAPLKQLATCMSRSSSRALPRLHRRGPIEADVALGRSASTIDRSSTASSPWPH